MERPSMVQEMVVLFSWGTTSVRMGASGLYLAIRLAVRPLLAYTTIRPACSSARLGWGPFGFEGRSARSGLDRLRCCGVGSSRRGVRRVNKCCWHGSRSLGCAQACPQGVLQGHGVRACLLQQGLAPGADHSG